MNKIPQTALLIVLGLHQLLAQVSFGALQDAATPAPEVEPAGPNLLKNPTFADHAHAWSVVAWAKLGTMQVDANELHNGHPSVRLENKQGDHTFFYQLVEVKPHTRYRLSGWIKTKDVESEKPNSPEGARLQIGAGFGKTEPVRKTKGWTYVSQEYTTGAESSIQFGASLGHFTDFMTGTAWFSELSVQELPPRRKSERGAAGPTGPRID